MTAALREAFTPAAKPSRERHAPRKKKTCPPISIRVTAEERARLEQEAGERTLSAYCRSRLFGAKDSRGPDRKPSSDAALLARILAQLGQSAVPGNLAVIADAIRSGTLDTDAVLLARVEDACAFIIAMRAELIRALGLKPE